MVKWIRVCALALCVLMLAPSGMAAIAQSGAGLSDNIIDELNGASDTALTQIEQENAELAALLNVDASADAQPDDAQPDDAQPGDAPTVADLQAAAADTAAQQSTPNFNAVDVTQPLTRASDGTDSSHQATDITKNCKVQMSEGKPNAMLDSKASTYWSNKKKAKFRVTIPANDTAGGLYIEWVKKPADFTLVEYDASNQEIQSRDVTSYTGLVSVFPLLEETKRVEMQFERQVGISTLRVFSQGELPTGVQNWLPPREKADLMLLVAHQDDEFLYFGGTIPYYEVVEEKAVQVVYMANCGRARYAEALTGLWAAGMRNSPDFIGLPDTYTKNLKDAKKAWKTDTVLKQLVARIRKYKPDVIVSHDLKGEYGHGAHMLTAEAVKVAIEQAADATKYPESADAYGVWQVSKLYLHLLAEKSITMDWTQPAEALLGKTPADVARLGYAAHRSQHKSFTYEDGGKYDNAKFGLAFTNVGDDELMNDFFENIVEGAERLNPGDLEVDGLDMAGWDSAETDTSMPDDDYFTGGLDTPAAADLDTVDNVDYDPAVEVDTWDDEDPFAALTQPETGTEKQPTEPGVPVNRGGLIAAIIGVPVLLGGSAFGTVAGRKYLKKRRRALRRAEKAKLEA